MAKRMKGEMTNFSVNLQSELVRKIEALAKADNRSRNNMIQTLLEKAAKDWRKQ